MKRALFFYIDATLFIDKIIKICYAIKDINIPRSPL